ncbi:MAG: DUF4176 domain-containing protein [Defluviitaleaceae bacterium]|nr:DUF4176 domain-containing protein [Defluviitaleaceae bacterium]
MKKYLPIGSVVLLKGAEKRIMIVGLKQKEADSEKLWDYSGVFYPEGIFDSDNLFLFNDGQIQKIFFMGFQDIESLEFNERLGNIDEKNKSESGDSK